MKQIKTITSRLSHSDEFDREVNKALEEGWMLVKRELLPTVDLGSTYQPSRLYAELEKEEERACYNCKHVATKGSRPPCRYCNNAANWEPKA